ncbi:HEAT repeat domain-containing protein [Chitinophaga sp. Hz27]|uniref:HEAT repeat domain-containing protein n=1 Tax=Chitinophaga sp. Hz27 TaxID=3347169 RepID=UPI0035DE7CF0
MSDLVSPLQMLATPSFLKDLLHYELERMGANFEYAPTEGTFSYLNLLKTDNYILTLVYKKPEELKVSRFYGNYASDQIICALSEQGISYDLFEQPIIKDYEVLDTSLELNPLTLGGTLLQGDALYLSSRRHVFSFKSGISNPVIALILGDMHLAKYTWEYEAATLKPVRVLSGTNDHTRIEFTCTILSEIGNETSLPILFKLLDYPAHNVRWQAARTICNIDIDQGIKALEFLCQDKNDEIRQLATKSLDSIKSFTINN